MKTIIQEIKPKPNDDKYSWQQDLKNNQYYNNDDNGIYMIMSRTGTGKTKSQYHKMLHFKNNNKESITIYVPFKNKNLVQQIYDKFIDYLQQDKIPIDKTPFNKNKINTKKKFISLGDNFTCIITTFCNDKESPKNILEKHDEKNPIIIDEFDAVQTQFGLIHAGCNFLLL